MGINNLDDLLKAELSRTDRRLILEISNELFQFSPAGRMNKQDCK